MKCSRTGNRVLQLVCALPLLVVLAACSAGGESGGGGTPAGATPVSGVFVVDGPVEGLGWTALQSGLAGKTDATGHFQYLPGDTLQFDLDGQELGDPVAGAAQVTAHTLFGATTLTDARVVNMAQLLLTLGGIPADQDPIRLPATLPPHVPAALNFSEEDFDRAFTALPLVAEAVATARLQAAFRTVAVTRINGGAVMSSPAGLICPEAGPCTGPFLKGTVVTLTAPDGGVTSWSGTGCAGTGACVVTVTTDISVTATFPAGPTQAPETRAPETIGTAASTFLVSAHPATANGGGGSTACSAGGVTSTCDTNPADFPSGALVRVTATPNSVSRFTGWTGGQGSAVSCNGTTAPCTFTLTADSSITANFNRPKLSVVVVGTGAVSSTPPGINNCTASCKASFDKGTVVTLTATGSGFTGWSGGGCSGTGTCQVTLNKNKKVTANFTGLPCPAEPTLVKDILTTGSAFATSGNELVDVNGTLFFKASDGVTGTELWKSDGTDAGTVLVKDIGPGNNTARELIPQFLTNVNGTLFFAMDDGVHGLELWKSDGTNARTVLVKDINPGSGDGFHFLLRDSLVAVGNTLFFTVNDGVNGVELWKSDGTEAGTVLVKNINPSGSSSPVLLTNANGTLFFGASDGVTGTELWKSDGTNAGTVLVKDIHPGGGASLNFVPNSMVNVNGTVFFAALPSTNNQLWKSDGTAGGTVFVKDIGPQELVNVDGTLFIDVGSDIWKSDGTDVGTVLVKALGGANEIASVGSKLYFRGFTPSVGNQPYISDGTAVGTGVLKSDLFLLGNASGVPWFTDVNGIAFFAASDGVTGVELWKSDGTAAGTVLVKDIVSGGSSGPTNLTKVDRKLFFIAGAAGLGRELWVVCGAP